MNNGKKSLFNIASGIWGQVITIAIGVLLPRLFITNYGSETNGFLSSINNMIYYLTLLEAGVGTATVQALYGPIARNDRLKINGVLSATNMFYKRTGRIYAICIIVMAFVYPLLVPSALSRALQSGIILLVGASGVVGYYYQAKFRLLLQAEGKQYVITNVATSAHVLTSIGKLICVIFVLPIIWLQAVHFLITLLQVCFYYIYIFKYYKWIDLKVQPDEAAISQKNSVLVHQISEMVFNHVDVLLLTFLVKDLKVVSVYVLYCMFVDMVSTLISNVNTGFIFKLGQLYNSEKLNVFTKTFDFYETYFMAFSFALYTVTYLFLMPFMKLYTAGVSDADYLLEWLPLLFVSYKLLVCGRGACGALSSYAGHFRQTISHSIIETSINLGVSIVAVIIFDKLWHLGIYGVLIGTLAALLYRANVMILYANKHILFRHAWSTYRKWLLDFIVMVACCFFFYWTQPSLTSYVKIILCSGIYCILFLLVFFSGNALMSPAQTKEAFQNIKNYSYSRIQKA